MKHMIRNERGIALAVAIFALVVVGALVAGAFFAGTQEQRIGENVRRGIQSFGVAEGGAYETIRTWEPESINNRPWYPTYTHTVSESPSMGGTGRYMGSVYKLNASLYLLDVTGADRVSQSNPAVGGARQRIGMLLRVRPLMIDTRASLTTQGLVQLGGNALVDGTMHVPPAWTNCDTIVDTTKAGVRTPDASRVQDPAGTHTVGDPKVLQDPSVTDSTFLKFGDVYYQDLAREATIKYVGPQNLQNVWPATNAAGQCDKTVLTNWGDGKNRNPPAACSSYYPVVHVAGDLVLNTGQGQGILLVDGNLDVQGGFEWFGILIVQGTLKSAGGAGGDPHFWGAVMARNADLNPERITGNATLNYSKCAILQALNNTQRVALMRSRSWVQLF